MTVITKDFIEKLKNDPVFPPDEKMIEDLENKIGEVFRDCEYIEDDSRVSFTDQDIYEQSRKRRKQVTD